MFNKRVRNHFSTIMEIYFWARQRMTGNTHLEICGKNHVCSFHLLKHRRKDSFTWTYLHHRHFTTSCLMETTNHVQSLSFDTPVDSSSASQWTNEKSAVSSDMEGKKRLHDTFNTVQKLSVQFFSIHQKWINYSEKRFVAMHFLSFPFNMKDLQQTSGLHQCMFNSLCFSEGTLNILQKSNVKLFHPSS